MTRAQEAYLQGTDAHGPRHSRTTHVIPAQPIRLDSRLRGNDGEGPGWWRGPRGWRGGRPRGWRIGGGNLAVWLRRRPGADVQVAADGGQGGVHLIQARVMSDVQHAVDLG